MNLCSSCGREIPENATLCPNCENGVSKEKAEHHARARTIASILTGIIGIAGIVSIFIFPDISSLFLLVFSLVFIFFALMLGLTGRKLARQLDAKNRVRAKKACLVFGILSIVGFLSLFLACSTSISLFAYLFAFSPIFMLLAVKFHIDSKEQYGEQGIKNRSISGIGLLLGIIGLILYIILAIFWALIWSSSS